MTKPHSTVPACRLVAHKLTVVQLEFTKDDQYLLSVSRDRQWTLFKRQSPYSFKFDLLRKEKDAHTRIIWGCSWSHEDAFFLTISREKHDSIKLWTGVTHSQVGDFVAKVPDSQAPSATAVRFFPSKLRDSYAFMVGLESGVIQAWVIKVNQAWSLMFKLPSYWSHAQAVRRIKFNLKKSYEGHFTVATCSNDNSVRIFELNY